MFLNPAEFVPCASITQICGQEGRNWEKGEKTEMETDEFGQAGVRFGNGTADGLHLERLYVRLMSETEAD